MKNKKIKKLVIFEVQEYAPIELYLNTTGLSFTAFIKKAVVSELKKEKKGD